MFPFCANISIKEQTYIEIGSSKNGMDLAKLCPGSQHYHTEIFKHYKTPPVLCFGIKIKNTYIYAFNNTFSDFIYFSF